MRLVSLTLSLLIAALVLPVTGAAAQDFVPEAEAAFTEAINASRAEEGLEPLVPNLELQGIARTWSVAMDAADLLSHNPSYAEEYGGHWRTMGENVGRSTYPGASAARFVEVLHQAFMDSPGHRANILGDYNQVGVGVLVDRSTMWVTVNFLDGRIPEVQDGLGPVVDRVEAPGLPVVDDLLEDLVGGPSDPEDEGPARVDRATEDVPERPTRPAAPRHFMRL